MLGRSALTEEYAPSDASVVHLRWCRCHPLPTDSAHAAGDPGEFWAVLLEPPCGFPSFNGAWPPMQGWRSMQPSSAGVQTRLQVQALTGPCTYAGIRSKVWSGKGDKTKAERDACSKTGNSPRVLPPIGNSVPRIRGAWRGKRTTRSPKKRS